MKQNKHVFIILSSGILHTYIEAAFDSELLAIAYMCEQSTNEDMVADGLLNLTGRELSRSGCTISHTSS